MGCRSREYLYEWKAWRGNIRLPHSVSVAINPATGEIFQYINYQRKFNEPTTPKLTGAEAEFAAMKAVGAIGASLDSTTLTVEFDSAGRQLLAWEVRLSSRDPRGWTDRTIVLVDAITGDAAIVGKG